MQELAKADRHKEKLSLVILDLDYLKDINELYGHVLGGDRALQVLADAIQALCRDEDTFCRYAGDEFVIILPDTPIETAYQRAVEWLDSVSKTKVDDTYRISFSAGVAEFPTHGIDGEALIQSADYALYKAKERGRSRVEIVEGESREQSRESKET